MKHTNLEHWAGLADDLSAQWPGEVSNGQIFVLKAKHCFYLFLNIFVYTIHQVNIVWLTRF